MRGKRSELSVRANVKLEKVIAVIDGVSQLMGEGEITETSFLRPLDLKSYHSKGQAKDLRVHDKSANWLLAMRALYNILRVDKQIYFNFHDELIGTPNAHLHVAIMDGSITKE